MSKAKLLHCIYSSNTMSIFLYISCPFKLFLSVFFVVVVVVPFLLKKEKNDKSY